MNWPWHRKRRDWQIFPQDLRWDGREASFLILGGWEPFGITSVPNSLEQNKIRIWTRRREPRMTRKKKVYEIKIQSAGWGGHQVLLHLTEGWEPFAISDSFGNHIVWFRRKVDT